MLVTRKFSAQRKPGAEPGTLELCPDSYQALLDSCPDAVAIVSGDWRLTRWNRRFGELWRLPAQRSSRKPARPWRQLRRMTKHPASLLRAFRGAEQGDFSTVIELFDGRMIELRGNRLNAAGGERAWYCRELTPRDRTLNTHRQLIEAIEAITDGFMLYDSSERLVMCNAAFRRLIGIEAVARPGVTMRQAVRAAVEGGLFDLQGADPERYIETVLATMRRGVGIRELRLASGKWLRIEDRATSDGGYVAIFSDITPLKCREEDLTLTARRAEAAEQLAARAEARLVEALQSLPEVFMLFDPEERLVFASNRRLEISPFEAPPRPGMTFEMMVRENMVWFLPDASPDELETFVAARLAEFRKGHSDVERRFHDGRWLRMIDRRTPSGDTVSLRIDITEARRREEELAKASLAWAERENQLRRIYANIPGIVYQLCMDAAGKFWCDFLSDRAEEVFGIPLDDLMRNPGLFAASLEPEDRAPVWAAVRRSAADITPVIIEFRVHRGGKMIWLRADARPTAKPEGGIRWDGVLIDVTDLKLTEAELRCAKDQAEAAVAEAQRAREQLEDAIESISEGFALYDPEGRLVLTNSRLKELYDTSGLSVALEPGRTFEEMLRCSLASFAGERAEAIIQARIEDFRKGNSSSEGQLADGRWVHASERRMRDGGTVAIRRDITILKRREEQLREALIDATAANKAKSEFLANMSHELRTPLNAIIGFSEMMATEIFGPLGSPRYLGYVNDIHSSGQHLLGIINTVLDLARVEAGKIILEDETIAVPGIVDSCISLLQDRMARGGIEFSAIYAPDLPRLRADPLRLRQVLLNLLSNAVKFTPDGGSVGLEAKLAADGSFAIEVRDTGIGMNPEDIPQAFEPFGLVSSAHSRAHEGTGLGLSLSRLLIEEHGGRLSLASTLGVGTVATVRLPPSRVVPAGG